MSLLAIDGYCVSVPAQDDFVEACRDKLAARQAFHEAVARTEEVLRRLHLEEGIPKNSIGPIARAILTDAGFTSEQIRDVGVSNGNVRLALEPLRNRGRSTRQDQD